MLPQDPGQAVERVRGERLDPCEFVQQIFRASAPRLRVIDTSLHR